MTVKNFIFLLLFSFLCPACVYCRNQFSFTVNFAPGTFSLPFYINGESYRDGNISSEFSANLKHSATRDIGALLGIDFHDFLTVGLEFGRGFLHYRGDGENYLNSITTHMNLTGLAFEKFIGLKFIPSAGIHLGCTVGTSFLDSSGVIFGNKVSDITNVSVISFSDSNFTSGFLSFRIGLWFKLSEKSAITLKHKFLYLKNPYLSNTLSVTENTVGSDPLNSTINMDIAVVNHYLEVGISFRSFWE